jgi:hypothetical protein
MEKPQFEPGNWKNFPVAQPVTIAPADPANGSTATSKPALVENYGWGAGFWY